MQADLQSIYQSFAYVLISSAANDIHPMTDCLTSMCQRIMLIYIP